MVKTAVALLLLMVALFSEESAARSAHHSCEGKPLLLTLVGAKGVYGEDGRGKPDVYIQVYNGNRYVSHTRVKSSFLPVWEQTVFIHKAGHLKLNIFDADIHSPDKKLGECIINTLPFKREEKLRRCTVGRVKLYYKYECEA